MNVLAKANANKILKDLFINSPEQLDLESIAGMENLFIEERVLNNREGELVFKDEIGVISIDASIPEKGQKRFTAAHEIGHYYNEIKPANKKENEFFFSCYGEDIRGISFKNIKEANANDFAAELLMPEGWFKKFTGGKKFNKQLLSEASEYFKTSLSAAAIRYAEVGNHPIAIIMSRDRKVKWRRINKYFPFQFIRPGAEVSSLSYSSEFYDKKPIPVEPEAILADAWFSEDFNYRKDYFLFEQNIPMHRYNAVLTILWEK